MGSQVRILSSRLTGSPDDYRRGFVFMAASRACPAKRTKTQNCSDEVEAGFLKHNGRSRRIAAPFKHLMSENELLAPFFIEKPEDCVEKHAAFIEKHARFIGKVEHFFELIGCTFQ